MTLARLLAPPDSRPLLGSSFRFSGIKLRSSLSRSNNINNNDSYRPTALINFLSAQSRPTTTTATALKRTVQVPSLVLSRPGRGANILPTVASSTQHSRPHGGHSHGPGGHGHHHHHDTTYLVSSNKQDPGVRITRIGLYVNLGMALAKGFGGWVFNSQALVADAFHALTDLVSDFMTLATISFSLKPPTTRFPSGYGKIESLGALGVSSLLLGGGVLMGWHAVDVLYSQLFLDAAQAAEHLAHGHGHGHGHSHAAADVIPNLNAAWLAAGSIVIKEWLYRATMKVARERKSSVLASNAVHHRVDSLTGMVAFVAIAGSHILHGASWLDPAGGLLVSGMVIRAGWSNTMSALLELADVSVDADVRDTVRKAALKGLKEGQLEDVDIRDVQGTKSGQNYLMDVDVALPGAWTVEDTRPIKDSIRHQIIEDVRGVKRLRINFVSKESPDEDSFVNIADPTEHEHDRDEHQHHKHD